MMKLAKYGCLVLFACFVFAAAGCSTSPSNNGIYMLTGIRIKYINKEGENLLNPDHPHAITEDNTNLYHLVNGKMKRIYKGYLDHPKMFVISNDLDSTGKYEMRIGPLTQKDKNKTTTYIKFKYYPTDTLKVQYFVSPGGIAVTKIWYNSKLKWDVDQGGGRIITVTKHFSGE